MRRFLILAVCGLALTACVSRQVDLAYSPSAPVALNRGAAAAAGPTIVVGRFVDQRGEPANWLGAIRGGFGNPVKTLTTPTPVNEVVRKGFEDGLAARHLLSTEGTAAYTLTGVVRTFDCTQAARREANADVSISLVDNSTGRTVFSRDVQDNVVSGSPFTLATGAFGSVDELGKVAAQALREVVDKALDDPGFRTAVKGKP